MALTADYVTNQPLTFKRMRQMLEEQGGGIQEGVTAKAANEFRVSQRAAGGANMSVDVQAGGGWVEIDTGSLNGFSHIESDAITNVAIPAAHATLPRIDQIVLQYNDTAIPAGVGGDIPTLRVIGGTATAGAQSTNPAAANYRLGAAALPNDCVRLADVQVDAAVGSILDAKILDRRPWARGALAEIVYTGGTQTVALTTFAAITAISAAIQQRVECSGAPLVIELDVRLAPPLAAGAYTGVLPAIDGAVPTATVGTDDISVFNPTAVSYALKVTRRWRLTPAAGSHLITVWSRVTTGSGAVVASAAEPLRLTIAEELRQVANNGIA